MGVTLLRLIQALPNQQRLMGQRPMVKISCLVADAASAWAKRGPQVGHEKERSLPMTIGPHDIVAQFGLIGNRF